MTNSPVNQVSLRDILIYIFKYRTGLLLAFFIPIILAIIISLVLVQRYHATSVLIVRLGSEYVYQPEVNNATNGNSTAIPFSPTQIFKSEVAMLDSDELHTQVINKIGIDRLFPDDYLIVTWAKKIVQTVKHLFISPPSKEEAARVKLANAIEKFEKRLDIELEKDSAVINLTFQNKDWHIAQETLDTLIKFYLEKRQKTYLGPRSELAKNEMLANQEKFALAERNLTDFKNKYRIYSLEDERQGLLTLRDQAKEQATRIKNAGIHKIIANYNRQLDGINELEIQLNNLQEEVKTAGESYSNSSTRYDEAKSFDDLEAGRYGSVKIIQSPTVPAEPKSWTMVIIIAGVFFGCVALVVVASANKFFQKGFILPKEIYETLGINLLADFMNSANDKKSWHELVHKLQNAKTLAFISAHSGEGVSFIAFNYAQQLSIESDKTVLLISAGKLIAEEFEQYQEIPEIGIADTENIYDALYVQNNLSLCRLTSLETPISSIIKNEDLWNTLKESFDYIIIDANSMENWFGAVALAAKSDATVIVIEAEKTPKPVVQDLINKLNVIGAEIEGVILNKRRFHIPHIVYKRLA